MEFLMKSSRLIIISKTFARRVAVPIPSFSGNFSGTRGNHTLFIFSIILRKILYRKPEAPMGSFNMAPRINNIDCQDDGLELPKGLSHHQLLNHVKQLHGIGQPPLLTRHFLKKQQYLACPEGDNLHKLDALTRGCSAPAPKKDDIMAPDNQIRVLQWNILSQTLSQHNDGFVCCPDEALTWDHRKYLIVQELLQTDPDIICLQEVDHFKFLQQVLGTQNYEGIFYPKPDSPCLYIEENNGPDGCAIFYRRDKFTLKHYDTRILEVWSVQSNQVAIAAQLIVKATGREFCIVTTHLKARNGTLMAKLRDEQGRDLVSFVRKFASEKKPLPILICGDFNAEPIEPIYRTILDYDLLQLASAYADFNSTNMATTSMSPKQKPKPKQDLLNETKEKCLKSLKEDNKILDLVEQSIEREPAYTTWKIREDGEECHTIDYVFYTRNQFKVVNCLDFPGGAEIGENRTPSLQYPSDHFSLVCDFQLLDDKPKIQEIDSNDSKDPNENENPSKL